MWKRAFDIAMSGFALLVLAVPMLAIAMAVRLESPGGALFRQRRAGWKGRPFTMLKFRTMRSDVDPYGHSPHSGDDPRLTRVGKWLRERSLDELPQLVNILRGEMSFVGPRPLYERQAAQWTPHQRGRLEVRPGLTGYAQAYGRASLPIEDKIEMDLYYVKNAGFLMDLGIIAATAVNALGRPEEVYETRYSREQEYEGEREDGCDDA